MRRALPAIVLAAALLAFGSTASGGSTPRARAFGPTLQAFAVPLEFSARPRQSPPLRRLPGSPHALQLPANPNQGFSCPVAARGSSCNAVPCRLFVRSAPTVSHASNAIGYATAEAITVATRARAHVVAPAPRARSPRTLHAPNAPAVRVPRGPACSRQPPAHAELVVAGGA